MRPLCRLTPEMGGLCVTHNSYFSDSSSSKREKGKTKKKENGKADNKSTAGVHQMRLLFMSFGEFLTSKNSHIRNKYGTERWTDRRTDTTSYRDA